MPTRPLEMLLLEPRGEASCYFDHWYRLAELVIEGKLPNLRDPFADGFPYD